MSERSKVSVSRHAMEIAVAVLTMLIGVAIAYGSIENGIGWDSTGPQGGTFPFYVGLLVVGASLGTIVVSVRGHAPAETFVDGVQLKRMALFAAPIIAFLAVAPLLGHYVGSALLVTTSMLLLGHRRIGSAVAVGLGVAIGFYLIFDLGFQVPLAKGPLLNALGIY